MKGSEIRKIRGKKLSQMQFCQELKEICGQSPTPSMLSKWENDVHEPDDRWQKTLLEYKEKKAVKNV